MKGRATCLVEARVLNASIVFFLLLFCTNELMAQCSSCSVGCAPGFCYWGWNEREGSGFDQSNTPNVGCSDFQPGTIHYAGLGMDDLGPGPPYILTMTYFSAAGEPLPFSLENLEGNMVWWAVPGTVQLLVETNGTFTLSRNAPAEDSLNSDHGFGGTDGGSAEPLPDDGGGTAPDVGDSASSTIPQFPMPPMMKNNAGTGAQPITFDPQLGSGGDFGVIMGKAFSVMELGAVTVMTGTVGSQLPPVVTGVSIKGGEQTIEFVYSGFDSPTLGGPRSVVLTFIDNSTGTPSIEATHTVTYLEPENGNPEGYSYAVTTADGTTRTTTFRSNVLPNGDYGTWILVRPDGSRQSGEYNLPTQFDVDGSIIERRNIIAEQTPNGEGAWNTLSTKTWVYQTRKAFDPDGNLVNQSDFLTAFIEEKGTEVRTTAFDYYTEYEFTDLDGDFLSCWGALRSITNPDTSWSFYEYRFEGELWGFVVDAVWTPWKNASLADRSPSNCRISKRARAANDQPIHDTTIESISGTSVSQSRKTDFSNVNVGNRTGTAYDIRTLWTNATGTLGVWSGTIKEYQAGMVVVTLDGTGKRVTTNLTSVGGPYGSATYTTDCVAPQATDVEAARLAGSVPTSTVKWTDWPIGERLQVDTTEQYYGIGADRILLSIAATTTGLDTGNVSTTNDGETTYTRTTGSLGGAKVETENDAAGTQSVTYTSADGSSITHTKMGTAAGADWEAQADLVEVTTNTTFESKTERVLQGGGVRLLSKTVKDGLGRPTAVTDEIGRVTAYSYDVAADGGEVVTETRPGSVTVESRNWRDGQLRSIITRDAAEAIVAAEYHDYAVNNGSVAGYAYGSITETIHYGSENGAHWKKITRNALGWVLREEEPGPTQSNGNPVPMVRAYTYDLRGLVTKVSATGLADYLYEYDDMQRLIKEGYDLNGDGVLLPTSPDTLTETIYGYEATAAAGRTQVWWEVTKQRVYNGVGSGGGYVETRQWRKLGTGPNHITRTVFADGVESGNGISNATERWEEITVNRAAKTETRLVKLKPPGSTSTAPGTASSQTFVNGLLVKATESGVAGSILHRYDAEGRLWKVIHPTTGTSEVAFDEDTGQVRTEARPGQDAITYTYFGNNHANAGQVASISQDDAGTIRYAYDALGRLTHQWGSGAQPLRYTYDAAHGGLTALRTYKGDDIPNTGPAPPGEFATASAALTQWVYHPGTAKLWKKVDAANQFTEYLYFDSGLLKTRKWARPVAAGSATKLATEYEYENVGIAAAPKRVPGRVTNITYNDGVTPNVTKTYYRNGHVATCVDAAGQWSFGNGGVIHMVDGTDGFNASEWVSSAPDSPSLADGFWMLRALRLDGQPGYFVTRWNGAQNEEQAGLYQYSADGKFVTARVKHMRGWFDITDYDVMHTSNRMPSMARGSTNVRGFGIVEWRGAHDVHGRLERVAYQTYMTPSGAVSLNYPMGWTYGEFDGAGRRKTVLPYKPAAASYTAAHPPAWSYDYNERGEVTGAARFRPEGSGPGDVIASQSRGYAFDGIGNRESAVVGASPVRTTLYHANALNQYADDSGTPAITNSRSLEISGTIAAGFTPNVKVDGALVPTDGIGTGEPGSFRAETVVGGEALWRQVEISTTDPATGSPVVLASGHRYVPPANETLRYDEDGNLIEDGRWIYSWDAENRLIGMEEKSGVGIPVRPAGAPPRKRLTFAYDARHRRIAKWVHEWDEASGAFSRLVKDLRFLYDGWNMTAELDHTFATGDGLHNCRPVREFFWGPDLSGTMHGAGGVGGLVSMKWQGSYYLPCIDGNGNIKGWLKLLGSNQYELTARYDYDPFGNRITDTGPGLEVSPFGFSTKYRDEETGLLDYGYRFYDPVRGRWLSRDPIGERGGLNLGGFVGNDSLNNVDALGLIDYQMFGGPVFAEADKAGRAAIAEEHGKSLAAKERNQRYEPAEWGGRICCLGNGRYTHTIRKGVGGARTVFLQGSPPCPEGSQQVAWWHSHPGERKAHPKAGDPYPFVPGGELSGTKGTGAEGDWGDTNFSDRTEKMIIMTRKTGVDTYDTTAYFQNRFYRYDPNKK